MAEPIEIPTHRMTVTEFFAWAEHQPKAKYELVDGQVLAMAPERVGHARAKAMAWLALRNAIRAAGLPCEAFVDGVSVVIDETTAYEPDALVNCGERLDGKALAATAPVIVVEVASPSTSRVDAISKLPDYFRLPSLQHYVIIDAGRRRVVHHRRVPDGTHVTWIAGNGPLRLDPPGITIRVEDLFEE